MNAGVGSARIGQWYLRRDKGEIFQVTGYDDSSGTIEIQSFDGEVDEIDGDSWRTLPLGLAESPEDWTGPVDDVELDDLGYSETAMKGADWAQPLGPYPASTRESWEETTPPLDVETEIDSDGTSAHEPGLGGSNEPLRVA